MQYFNISFFYIVNHLVRRAGDFFRHWYIDGFLKAINWTLNILEALDRRFAIQITAKNWMQPLYQDYSIIGYIWGFVFRTFRIFAGLLVYGIFLAAAILLFAGWAALPAVMLYKIFTTL